MGDILGLELGEKVELSADGAFVGAGVGAEVGDDVVSAQWKENPFPCVEESEEKETRLGLGGEMNGKGRRFPQRSLTSTFVVESL